MGAGSPQCGGRRPFRISFPSACLLLTPALTSPLRKRTELSTASRPHSVWRLLGDQSSTGETRTRKMDDARLVAQFQRGEDEAFDELVERHRRRIYSLVCRLATPAEADDLAQEVFIAAY